MTPPSRSPSQAPWIITCWATNKGLLDGFDSDGTITDEVPTWVSVQRKTLFDAGLKRIVNCYTICFEKRGDYVEKWYTLHLSQSVVHEVINGPSSLYLFYSALHKYKEGFILDWYKWELNYPNTF